MIEVVGVRFKPATKIYYFSPEGRDYKLGDEVVVETVRGIEYGSIVIENRLIDKGKILKELKTIIRIADDLDKKIHMENIERAKDAMDICNIKVRDHELEMKLVDCEYTFDGQKLIFYFTSDGRIDFRNLVKELAQIFRTRIELRQVGVRDHAKLLKGLGQCGQETCCSRHLSEFQPVSIKMAKDQGLPLNPSKISGVCGRLMCCLNYEQEVYLEHAKKLPSTGARYCSKEGCGVVVGQKLLEKKVTLKISENDQETFIDVEVE